MTKTAVINVAKNRRSSLQINSASGGGQWRQMGQWAYNFDRRFSLTRFKDAPNCARRSSVVPTNISAKSGRHPSYIPKIRKACPALQRRPPTTMNSPQSKASFNRLLHHSSIPRPENLVIRSRRNFSVSARIEPNQPEIAQQMSLIHFKEHFEKNRLKLHANKKHSRR